MDAMRDASVSHSAEAALKGPDDLCNTSLKPQSLTLMVLTSFFSLIVPTKTLNLAEGRVLHEGGLPVPGSFTVTFIGHKQHRCCVSIEQL